MPGGVMGLAARLLAADGSRLQPARKSDGWVKSGVFGKSFKLVPEEGSDELPAFRLLVR